MKKKLALSLLGLSTLTCTGLMVPLITSCTNKGTIVITTNEDLLNGIQSVKGHTVLKVHEYNGEDVDTSNVSFSIKGLPNDVNITINGSTLSWDLGDNSCVATFRIVPELKGYNSKDTVVNVNTLANRHVAFASVPSEMLMFPFSSNFWDMLDSGTVYNDGPTQLNDWQDFVDDKGTPAQFSYKMGAHVVEQTGADPFVLEFPQGIQAMIGTVIDIQQVPAVYGDSNSSFYKFQWRLHYETNGSHNYATFADLMYDLSRFISTNEQPENVGSFDFNFSTKVSFNHDRFETDDGDTNVNYTTDSVNVDGGGELFTGWNLPLTFAEKLVLPTLYGPTTSSDNSKFNYTNSMDAQTNADFTSFLKGRQYATFSFPIAQYGVLFGQNESGLEYTGPSNSNDSSTKYTEISEDDLEIANQNIQTQLTNNGVNNLHITLEIRKDQVWARYQYVIAIPFQHETTTTLSDIGGWTSLDGCTDVKIGDFVSGSDQDGNPVMVRVKDIRLGLGYDVAPYKSFVPVIKDGGDEPTLSNTPGATKTLNTNDWNSTFDVGDIFSAEPEDGTNVSDTLVGVIKTIQGNSISVETISNYSTTVPLTTTPDQTTTVDIASLKSIIPLGSALDSVYKGQIVNDKHGTVGIITEDSATSSCTVRTVNPSTSVSDDIDFQKFSNACNTEAAWIRLPSAQFNPDTDVWTGRDVPTDVVSIRPNPFNMFEIIANQVQG